jgi:hypothetical protein
MSNTDSSSSARLRQIKARTLAVYHAQNPTRREITSGSLDASLITARASGLAPIIRSMDTRPAQVTPGCCSEPVQTCIQVIAPTDVTYVSGNVQDEIYTWTTDPNATSYTFSSDWHREISFTMIGNNSVSVTYVMITDPSDPEYDPNLDYDSVNDTLAIPTFTVTANNSCSSSTSAPITVFPCFLAGSLVAMADGTQKAIEDVCCGDLVIGAFGEINTVLALHRPLLGKAGMIRINDEHSSTAHHPHIGSNKEFYCADISALEKGTYGCEHEVLNADGNKEMRMLYGLAPGRTQLYTIGASLKTVEGSRVLESLERYSLPEDTQLYNLVVGGSHTYHVDGYAVTGWPREDDFDYDTWTVRV